MMLLVFISTLNDYPACSSNVRGDDQCGPYVYAVYLSRPFYAGAAVFNRRVSVKRVE